MKTILLTIIALGLLGAVCDAQTKIGNITISDAEAKAYFLDCYNKPDTIPPESEYGLPDRWGTEQNTIIRNRNNDLEKSSIGKAINHWHNKAHRDTLYDGEPLEMYRINNWPIPKVTAKTKVTYENVPEKSGSYLIGYLVARKPTETDYIKYLKRTSKL